MCVAVLGPNSTHASRFYSASLLLTYDGGDRGQTKVDCRLIDFAKTMTPVSPEFNPAVHVGADEGMLFGLHSLKNFLTELSSRHIRSRSHGSSTTDGLRTRTSSQ